MDPIEPSEKKIRRISISGTGPMSLSETGVEMPSRLSPEQIAFVDVIAPVVRAYIKSAKALMAGKYAHLKDVVPAHLSNPGNIFVACTEGSVVIRFEGKASEEKSLMVGWIDQDLPTTIKILSQNLVYCRRSNEEPPRDLATNPAIEIKAIVTDPSTGATKPIFSMNVGFDLVALPPTASTASAKKPHCVASIRNYFEIGLKGVIADKDGGIETGQPFITRTALKMPVGWECIEIYPFVDVKSWKEEYAEVWAETDILAAVVAHQARESHYQSLDPNAAARRKYAALLDEFKKLLDSNPEKEETLQVFLKKNPALLCPTHTSMWPKLSFGAHVTDFVFRDATGEYLLVELEQSLHSLFKKDGHPTAELNHARGQIADWKRYIEDNLATVQRELRLTGISANPRALIVIGRNNSLDADLRRKLVAMENESPKLKILTYDDIFENAKAVIENLLGPIWEAGGTTSVYYPPKSLPPV